MESADPVLYDFPLPLQGTFYPLGFRLTIDTNSEAVLTAAGESWGRFQAQFSATPLHLRVAVSAAQRSAGFPMPVVRAQGNLIAFVGDSETFATGDLKTGFGFCWVTPAIASDRQFFRYHYLDALVLTLLDARHVSTIHAGCVALEGRGILLCGASTAGKSTLSYACARQGWDYLCDDASALVRNSGDRTVAGNPYRLRLRPDAVRFFPEIEGRPATVQSNGKLCIELATATELSISLIASCQIHAVLFVDRTGGKIPTLTPVGKSLALDELAAAIPFGSQEERSNRLSQYRTLLEVPTYRFHYGDLDDSVVCLTNVVRNGF